MYVCMYICTYVYIYRYTCMLYAHPHIYTHTYVLLRIHDSNRTSLHNATKTSPLTPHETLSPFQSGTGKLQSAGEAATSFPGHSSWRRCCDLIHRDPLRG